MITVIKNINVYAPEKLGKKDVVIVSDKIEGIYDNVNIPCWRSHLIHEKRAPYPFVQSHAIHCSEPLNSRREPLQFMK